jgi:hypothetical protein
MSTAARRTDSPGIRRFASLELRAPEEAGSFEARLVALRAGEMEGCRNPAQERYEDRTRCGRGQQVAPAAFPDLLLPVDDILPRVPPS